MLVAYWLLYLICVSIFIVMSDELSPIEKLRELVLSICVQYALVEVEPINCHPPVPLVIEIDTSSSFATDKAFATRDELIEWARKVALELKFSIVIERSDYIWW
jgi:hypothetical protein